MSLASKAQALLDLHRPGRPAVLPTVWDPWSAQLAADAGFPALTVGSHAVAAALGREDHEDLGLDEMLAQVAVIAGAVDLPVSADLESGYGSQPARVVEGLLAAGAVGLDIEDPVHRERGRLRGTAEHAEVVAALRAAADQAGVRVVITARTDIILRGVGEPGGRSRPPSRSCAPPRTRGPTSSTPIGLVDDDTLSAPLPSTRA